MIEMPTYDEVAQAPLLLRRRIPAEYEDGNGHVNIRHYLTLHNDAGEVAFEALGIDDAYRNVRRHGIFDVEHHLRYRHELLVGDEVAVYGRLLGRTAKVLHGMWFLVDTRQRRLANTLEFITAHVDLETRKVVAFPDDLARGIDVEIERSEALAWEAPVCGALSLGDRGARAEGAGPGEEQ